MSNTALVIIDMQNDCVSSTPAPTSVTAILPKVKDLLSYFRTYKIPVFHIVREYRADGSNVENIREQNFLKEPRLVPGTKGCEIIADIAPIAGEYIVVKWRFSAFMGTEFDLLLRRLKIQDLLICGTQAPNCVRCTVYDAVSLEYNVTVITDAVAARTEAVHKANMTDIANLGVPCMTLDEWLKLRVM